MHDKGVSHISEGDRAAAAAPATENKARGSEPRMAGEISCQ